ncbi:MAG: hypothetical protein IPM39_25990 [Chloroflexi bacterium]|nr:hypothetical protein [Chloroflexota bacterium]
MQHHVLDNYETVRTTVISPANLLQRSQELVNSGQVPNRNALFVAALEQFIADLERDSINRHFAVTVKDADYQAFQTETVESL